MPVSPSRKLAQRHARYIGVNERSPWGRRAADMGIMALKGHAPIAVKSLDFGEIAVPSAAAMLAAPLRVTISDVNTATSPTTVCSNHNGYVLLNPGTKADSGSSYQWNVADVPSSLMQWYSGPNTTISATRDIYWGCRLAASTVTAWDGKFFMGLAITDTDGVMTETTGVLDDVADCIGFHVGETGVMTLATRTTATGLTSGTVVAGATAPVYLGTGNIAHVAADPTTLTSAYFHDFFFHAHWGTAAATGTDCFVEGYYDGKLIWVIRNTASTLPDITSVSLYNIIEIVNGPANDQQLAVAEILNASPRYHIA